jgi:hypothetical protein
MADEKPSGDNYPLLSSIVRQRGLEMKAIWRHDNLVQLFEVSVRTIQDWESDPEKEFPPRDLPGGRGHLCEDLEEFLRKSQERGRRRRRKAGGANGGEWDGLRPDRNSRKRRRQANPRSGGEPSAGGDTPL